MPRTRRAADDSLMAAAREQRGTVALHHPQAISNRLESPLLVKAKRRNVRHIGVHEHALRTKPQRPVHRVGQERPRSTAPAGRWRDGQTLQIRRAFAGARQAVGEGLRCGEAAPTPGSANAEQLSRGTRVVERDLIESPLIAEGGNVDAHGVCGTNPTNAPGGVAPRMVVIGKIGNEEVELLSNDETQCHQCLGASRPNGAGAYALEVARRTCSRPLGDQFFVDHEIRSVRRVKRQHEGRCVEGPRAKAPRTRARHGRHGI